MFLSFSRLSFLSFLVVAIPFVAAEEKKEEPKFEIAKGEQKIMDLINKERAKENLPA